MAFQKKSKTKPRTIFRTAIPFGTKTEVFLNLGLEREKEKKHFRRFIISKFIFNLKKVSQKFSPTSWSEISLC